LSQIGTYFYRIGQSAQYASTETLRARAAMAGVSGSIAKAGLAAGGAALLFTGAADSLGATNTVMLGMIGGPLGAVAGGFLDLAKAGKKADDITANLSRSMRD